jgi:hypothetical protein
MEDEKVENKRDPEIQKIFENADDSIMGILGYNIFLNVVETIPHYTKIQKVMPDVDIKHAMRQIEKAIENGCLPNNLAEEMKEYHINNFRKNSSYINNTSIWIRDFDKHDLINSVSTFLEPFSMKISFVYMLSVFESTIGKFIDRLDQIGEKQFDLEHNDLTLFENRNIKRFIFWVYTIAHKNTISHNDLKGNLPLTIRLIDIARWIRNCIAHNRGLITQSYYESKPSKIDKYENLLKIEVDNNFIKTNISRYSDLRPLDRIELVLANDFTIFSRAIMDLFFLVHDSIQENFFKVKEAYNYERERKRINFRELYEC